MKLTPLPMAASSDALMVSVTTAIQPVPDWLMRIEPSELTRSTTATWP